MTRARFAFTLFVSATLLFACQPMVARMIAPLLGGSPSVWIVCSLCFQALLLAGYCYAHVVGTRLPLRAQVALQVSLVASAFFVLPVGIHEGTARWAEEGHPTVGLILLLLRGVGIPFFVLSTTSPLVQRWFAELGEEDPYYLYVASNAGSMLALLGYPFVLEPLFSVSTQSRALSTGYAAYAALVVACAVTVVRGRSKRRVDTTPAPPGVSSAPSSEPPPSARTAAPTPRWLQRLTWVALAFAPSSLLLGATQYVTTDIASMPLLWVVPLALYLGSFIVAFSKRPPGPPRLWSRLLVPFAAVVASMMLGGVLRPAWAVAFAHFALLFVGSVVCHQALARRRPPVQRLTEFYLLMSVGGVLGGVWNGLVAPVVFDDLLEYPVAIGLVCAARLFVEKTGREHVRRDVAWGLGLGAVTFGLVRLGAAIGARPATAVVWMFGAPVLCALAWRKSPTRYGVALACIMLAGMTYGGSVGQVTWRHRNFFGALKVARDPTGRYLTLVYGRTMHGQQALDPRARRVPLAYYHPTGPAGDVLDVPSGGRRVGVIGLTVGSLAAYAMPGDRWTFFEENPAVVEVARNQFTFLRDVPVGARVEVEVGDARLRLRQGPAARFDVLVLDAFSSDAVPIQLVTRQALEVYRRALAPGGVLLAHVSNRYVRLPPVFAALAKDAGMVCVERRDDHVAPALAAAGKVDSDWVLLASSADAVRLVSLKNAEWHTLVAPEGQPVWSDGFANVLGAMQL